jgi:hypothetical protein
MKKITKVILLFLAAIILVTGLTGCTEASRDLLMGFVQEWINTKFGIDTTDTSTSGRFIAGIKMAALIGKDSTGNADADAALGTVKMVTNFARAESLMENGRKKDDAALMDQAIALRPRDWSYRVSRATLAFKQNDEKTADKAFHEGENYAYYDHNENGLVRFYSQYINELEDWKNSGKLDQAPSWTQVYVYGHLSTSYARRYKITQDPKDKQMADYYEYQNEHVK